MMKLLCSALPVLAAQPFTGTWKLDTTTARGSGTPTKHELTNGMFKCLSCGPPVTVKADGTDQAVAGVPGVDTMSVRIVDDHTIEIVRKNGGKIVQHV
jgi:hypothetical protein